MKFPDSDARKLMWLSIRELIGAIMPLVVFLGILIAVLLIVVASASPSMFSSHGGAFAGDPNYPSPGNALQNSVPYVGK